MSPVTLTLNFTTIAEAVAFMAGRTAPITQSAEVVVASPKADKPVKEPAKAENKPAAEKPAEAEKSAASTATQKDSQPAMKYDVLKKAVVALATKSRDAAMAVAGEFGVANFQALNEARWPEALAAVEAKLVELNSADEVA